MATFAVWNFTFWSLCNCAIQDQKIMKRKHKNLGKLLYFTNLNSLATGDDSPNPFTIIYGFHKSQLSAAQVVGDLCWNEEHPGGITGIVSWKRWNSSAGWWLSLPLWSQLGWWISQYMGRIKNAPNHQPVWNMWYLENVQPWWLTKCTIPLTVSSVPFKRHHLFFKKCNVSWRDVVFFQNMQYSCSI